MPATPLLGKLNKAHKLKVKKGTSLHLLIIDL